MKEMKKIFALFVVAITVFSCSRTSDTIFDGSRSIVYFERSSLTLDVILDAVEPNIDTMSIVTSSPSNQDRTVFVSLNEEQTTITEDAFEFSQEVVIPAGELSGVFVIEGFENDDLTTSNDLIVFNITEVSDGSDLNGTLTELEVTIRLSCPLDDEFFVGAYEMEMISEQENPFFGDFGRSLGTQVVNVTRTGLTTREFTFEYFPDGFASPYTMFIEISCAEVFVSGSIDEGQTLGCDGETSIGVGTPNVPTIISTSIEDNDVITFDVLDFAQDGGCGTTPYIATLQFTKQ